MKLHPVKITVMKKLFHQDMVDLYTEDPSAWVPCQLFEVGQEFTVDGLNCWVMPEGFCGWAWADMQKLILGIARGGHDVFVTCCTDGYRPVVFKLEKLPEQGS